MTIKTKGIVLKRQPYKENDYLVYVYTYDYGKITLLAKGAKKMTSKNAQAVIEMSLGEFEIDIRKGISPLRRGIGLNYFKNIQSSIECEIIASYLLEYYYRYIDENKPNEEDYMMLLKTLELLDEGLSILLVYALILNFIMKKNGILLDVDKCVKCGDTKVNGFEVSEGGFVCKKHNLHKVMDKEELKAIRYLYKMNYLNIYQVNIDDKYILKTIKLFNYYIEEYAGIILKSKSFIKQIVLN